MHLNMIISVQKKHSSTAATPNSWLSESSVKQSKRPQWQNQHAWFERHTPLTHKRGRRTPIPVVFPAHCKGNSAVSDNWHSFSTAWVSRRRCWTSVCTGCCFAWCFPNPQWAAPHPCWIQERRGPSQQTRLCASSLRLELGKPRRWEISAPF